MCVLLHSSEITYESKLCKHSMLVEENILVSIMHQLPKDSHVYFYLLQGGMLIILVVYMYTRCTKLVILKIVA